MPSIAITQTLTADVTIAVSAGPGNIRDYVALYLPGAATYFVWSYLNNGRNAAQRPPKGLAAGSMKFTNLSLGKYEAKLFSLTDAGVATLLATQPFDVGAAVSNEVFVITKRGDFVVDSRGNFTVASPPSGSNRQFVNSPTLKWNLGTPGQIQGDRI